MGARWKPVLLSGRTELALPSLELYVGCASSYLFLRSVGLSGSFDRMRCAEIVCSGGRMSVLCRDYVTATTRSCEPSIDR